MTLWLANRSAIELVDVLRIAIRLKFWHHTNTVLMSSNKFQQKLDKLEIQLIMVWALLKEGLFLVHVHILSETCYQLSKMVQIISCIKGLTASMITIVLPAIANYPFECTFEEGCSTHVHDARSLVRLGLAYLLLLPILHLWRNAMWLHHSPWNE